MQANNIYFNNCNIITNFSNSSQEEQLPNKEQDPVPDIEHFINFISEVQLSPKEKEISSPPLKEKVKVSEKQVSKKVKKTTEIALDFFSISTQTTSTSDPVSLADQIASIREDFFNKSYKTCLDKLYFYINQNAVDSDAFSLAACCHLYLKNPKEADKFFHAAFNLMHVKKERMDEGYLGLALGKLNLEEYDNVLENCVKALNFSSSRYQASSIFLHAIALFMQKKWTLSEESYKTAYSYGIQADYIELVCQTLLLNSEKFAKIFTDLKELQITQSVSYSPFVQTLINGCFPQQ